MPERIKSLKKTFGEQRHIWAIITHKYANEDWAVAIIKCYIENVTDEVISISQFNPTYKNQIRSEILIKNVRAISAPDIDLHVIFDRPIESI